MFKFDNVQYVTTRRGVLTKGVVLLNGQPVGTFEEQPFAACLVYFDDNNTAVLFAEAAQHAGMDVCDYAEKLLEDWEDTVL
jgi:hypothetical protein